MLERMFSTLADWIKERPRRVILALFIPTLALAYLALTVKQDLTFSALLPDDHPLLMPFWEAIEDFGATSELLLVLEGDDPEALKTIMAEIAPRVEASPMVAEVTWRAPVGLMEKNALLFLSPEALSQVQEALRREEAPLKSALQTPGADTPLRVLQALIQGQGTIEVDDASESRDIFAPWGRLLSLYALALTQDLTPMEFEGALGDALSGRWPKAGRLKDPGGAFLSPDGALLLGRVRLAVDPLRVPIGAEGIGDLYSLSEEILKDHPGVTASFAGLPAVAYEDQSYILDELRRLSPISLALMLLLFLYVDRGLRTPLMVGFCMVVALLWTFGLIHLIFGVVTAMGAVFGILLFGLGIDYAVHLVVRYREELSKGLSQGSALHRSVVRTGPSILGGALTTAFAFFTLLGFEMNSTDQLGVTTGVGILCCFAVMMTLLPALIMTLGKGVRHGNFREDLPWLDSWVGLVVAHPKAVMAVTAGAIACALLYVPTMRIETDMTKVFTQSLPSLETAKRVDEHLGISSDVAMVIAEDVPESRRLAKALSALPEVRLVEGIHQLIPEDQDARVPLARALAGDIQRLLPRAPGESGGIDALKAALRWQRDALKEFLFIAKLGGSEGAEGMMASLRRGIKGAEVALAALESAEGQRRFEVLDAFAGARLMSALGELAGQGQIEAITLGSLPASIRQGYVGESGRLLLRVHSRLNLLSLEGGDRLREAISTVTPKSTGIHDLARAMVTSGLERLPIVSLALLGLITLGLVIGFGDWVLALYAVVPLMVSGLIAGGLTLAGGHGISILVGAAIPLILGIGIDDGIHVVLRWRELLEEGLSMESALREATHRTGRAILMTTITTMSGFGVLILIDHAGIKAMATMVTLGVGSCFITSVTVLPAVIVLGERLRRPTRADQPHTKPSA